MLLSYIKGINYIICKKKDDSKDYLVKKKISHSQKGEYSMNSFMWNVVAEVCGDRKRVCRYVGQSIQNFMSKIGSNKCGRSITQQWTL